MGIKSSNSLDGVKELRNMFQDIMSYEQKMDKLILNMNTHLLIVVNMTIKSLVKTMMN